jgi:cytoskeletal protein RodZ
MSYSKEYIAGLLEKFMNGESSLEEEKVLSEYFRDAADVPSEWRDYKSMFEYFNAGMPIAAEKSSSREGGIFMKSHRLRNILLAACIAGIAVGVGFAVLAPRQNSSSIDNVVATNIQDSSVSAPKAAETETPAAPIPEASSTMPEYAAQPKSVLSAPTEAVPAKEAEAVHATKSAATVSSKSADAAVQEELVRQIRNQVIEIAKQQVRAKMIDAVMATRGYERVLTENGTETYYNEEKTIAL